LGAGAQIRRSYAIAQSKGEVMVRIKTLDSVRGVAALTVLFNHCYFVFPEAIRNSALPRHISGWASPWPWLRYTPLHLMVAGSAAVMVFFVLSGFVLTLPFVEDTQPPYRRYLIKRFCRIWLPFALAILASAVLYELIAPKPISALSAWFNRESWSAPVTARLVVGHLLMTGSPTDRTLDNAMWSLVHELRVSIAFPFLVLLVRARVGWALTAALMLNIVCEFGLRHISEDTLSGTLLTTGVFVVAFVCGIALALNTPIWQRRLRTLSGPTRAVLSLLTFGALAAPASILDAYLIWIAGAVGLLALCLTSRFAERVLSLRPLQWLGRVSYSLYLTHLLVLLSLVHLYYGRVPLLAIVLGTVVASLVLAQITYLCVERPAIAIGRRLTAPVRTRDRQRIVQALCQGRRSTSGC
jgi:peptidoglycan/LPS O-acetylase OafA/YrhL